MSGPLYLSSRQVTYRFFTIVVILIVAGVVVDELWMWGALAGIWAGMIFLIIGVSDLIGRPVIGKKYHKLKRIKTEWSTHIQNVQVGLDLWQALLSLLSVAIYVQSTYTNVEGVESSWQFYVNIVLLFFFALDFFIGFAWWPNPLHYVLQYDAMIDMLTIVPELLVIISVGTQTEPTTTQLSGTQFLRIIRLLRILRLLRAVRQLTGGGNDVAQSILRLAITVICLIFCAAGVYRDLELDTGTVDEMPFHEALRVMTVLVLGRPNVPANGLLGALCVCAVVATSVVLIPVKIAGMIQTWNAQTKYRAGVDADAVGTHVLVVGQLSGSRLGDFLAEFFSDDYDDVGCHVVFVSQILPTAVHQTLLEHHKYKRHCTYIHGSIMHARDANLAAVESAEKIVFFPSGGKNIVKSSDVDESDFATISRVLAVKSSTVQSNQSLSMTVALLRRKNIQYLYPLPRWDSKMDQCIAIDETAMGLLALTVTCPGLPTFISNMLATKREVKTVDGNGKPLEHASQIPPWVMEYSDGACKEVYAVRLRGSPLVGKSMIDCASCVYRARHIVCVALEVALASKEPYLILFPGKRDIVVGQDDILYVLAFSNEDALAVAQCTEAEMAPLHSASDMEMIAMGANEGVTTVFARELSTLVRRESKTGVQTFAQAAAIAKRPKFVSVVEAASRQQALGKTLEKVYNGDRKKMVDEVAALCGAELKMSDKDKGAASASTLSTLNSIVEHIRTLDSRIVLVYGSASNGLLDILVTQLRPPQTAVSVPVVIISQEFNATIAALRSRENVFVCQGSLLSHPSEMTQLLRLSQTVFCLHRHSLNMATANAEEVDKKVILDTFKMIELLSPLRVGPHSECPHCLERGFSYSAWHATRQRAHCSGCNSDFVDCDLCDQGISKVNDTMATCAGGCGKTHPSPPPVSIVSELFDSESTTFFDALISVDRIVADITEASGSPAYFLNPLYASGKLFTTFTIDAMLHQACRPSKDLIGSGAVFPNTLLLMKSMLQGYCSRIYDLDEDGHAFTSKLFVCDLPKKLANAPFATVFETMLQEHQLVTMALNRFPRAALGNSLPFVYTNPPPHTVVHPFDTLLVMGRHDSLHPRATATPLARSRSSRRRDTIMVTREQAAHDALASPSTGMRPSITSGGKRHVGDGDAAESSTSAGGLVAANVAMNSIGIAVAAGLDRAEEEKSHDVLPITTASVQLDVQPTPAADSPRQVPESQSVTRTRAVNFNDDRDRSVVGNGFVRLPPLETSGNHSVVGAGDNVSNSSHVSSSVAPMRARTTDNLSSRYGIDTVGTNAATPPQSQNVSTPTSRVTGLHQAPITPSSQPRDITFASGTVPRSATTSSRASNNRSLDTGRKGTELFC